MTMESRPEAATCPGTGEEQGGAIPRTVANPQPMFGKFTLAEMQGAIDALDWVGPPTKYRDPFPNTPANHVVYFVGGDDGPIKIGWTQNLKNRLPCIQNGSSIALRVLATQKAPKLKERLWHKEFAASRVLNEWFDRTPKLMSLIESLNRDVARITQPERP